VNKPSRINWIRVFVLIGLVIPLTGFDAWANGFRNPPEGAAALGKAGGKIAFSDDASAITHNPANLVNVGELTLLQSVVLPYANWEFTGLDGRTGESKDDWKLLGSGHVAASSEDGKFGYGIALTAPYGQSSQWSDNGPFAFVAPQFAQLRTIAVNPTMAAKVSDWLDIGAGVNIYRSDISLRQLYPWSVVTGDPTSQPGNVILKGDGLGVGASIGMTVHVPGNQRVALTYRSESTISYEGRAELKNFPGNLPFPVNQIASPTSRFATEITFPNIVGLGYGIALHESVQFGIDIEWIEFSSFESLPLDIGNNQPLLPNSTIPQNWNDTWTLGCGADWSVNDLLSLRAGYVWLESPVPEETFAPTLPDTDRHVVSVGVGLSKDRHQVDVAYMLSFYDDAEINNNVNPAFNGTYEGEGHLIQLSYAITF